MGPGRGGEHSGRGAKGRSTVGLSLVTSSKHCSNLPSLCVVGHHPQVPKSSTQYSAWLGGGAQEGCTGCAHKTPSVAPTRSGTHRLSKSPWGASSPTPGRSPGHRLRSWRLFLGGLHPRGTELTEPLWDLRLREPRRLWP